MRRSRLAEVSDEYKIMIIDDEEGILDSIQAMLTRNGYWCECFSNPLDGLKALSEDHFDLLVLDYFMQPMHGEQVVEQIRKTNLELYILLLTGHKDLAPPISTIKSLAIQAYCEKSDRLDQLQLLIESGIKSISQMRMIQKFRDGLESILGSVPKIYQLQPIGNIMEEILEQLLPLANSEDAFILIDDIPRRQRYKSEGPRRSIYRGIGKYNVNIEDFPDLLDHELMEAIGRARTSMEVITNPSGVIVPLGDELNTAIGAIYVSSYNLDEGIKLLEIYARQAASSINNAFLHSLVNMKNEELNSTYAQLKGRYMDTIEVLRLAVDAKDEYTRGHSDRVAFYATKIGRNYGLPTAMLEQLRIAGIFHDIGKVGTADDILLKEEHLNLEEFEEVKQHPVKGAMILSAVSMFKDIVPIVRHHHEHIDGTGYPDGLKGEEIGIPACIISVADAFDTMMSGRHYKGHLSFEEAKQQLIKGSGTQFHPEVVKVFMDMLENDEELLALMGIIPDDMNSGTKEGQ